MKRNCLGLALAGALLLATSPGLFAATANLPKGISAGPSIEGISEYTLANGMRVLLFPDASKPTVTVNLVYGVGSVQENYGETGMAHLLEHLLFKGTPTHTDIPGEMQKRGIDKNASTSLDRTNYYASFPANDDTLAWVLGMEADRMVNSNVAQKDLDSEMTVVRNELEAGENNPGAVLFQRVRAAAYDWHNYGNTTIGSRSDVEGVPIGNLQAFYRKYYQPDNATLIIAGRIDPQTTLARIASDFGKLKRPTRPLPSFHTTEAAQDGERSVMVRRVGDLQLVLTSYHVPAKAHADSAALSVLTNVLGDVPRGRLHKALVENKLAASTGAGSESMHDPGLFNAIAVLPRDGDAGKAEAELLKQIEDLAARPVSQAEVDEAKQRIANSYDLYFTDVNAVGMGLSEFQAAGDWRLLFVSRDAAAKVTAADVNRVAAKYFKSSNRTLGRFIPTDKPDRAEISPAPPIASLVDGYVGKAVVAGGEAFDPTPANIDARTQTFTLGNGLKVSLLPKKTRGQTVVLNANFRFGDEKSITSVPDGAASIAGALLMRGSKTLSREQIAQKFDALNVRAGISGSAQGASIGLFGKREQLAEALALAADVLRNPVFPESEFEQVRLQAITGTEAARKEPGSIAGNAMSQYFDPWPVGHPLHVDSVDESLAKLRALKLDDVRAFHRDFYGTAEGEISVVGDFDPAQIRQQLESLFVGWKSPQAYAPISTHYQAVAAKRVAFETPDKPNAVFLARSNIALKKSDPEVAAMMVADRVFGGDTMKSRLGDRIRQKEGLSYGVNSAFRADDSRGNTDDAGYIVVQAIAAPQNMAKVETAVREELARLVKDGISEDELKNAVSGLLTERQQGRSDDGNLANALADDLYYGRNMQFAAARETALKALTVAEVNAAIRKYYKPEDVSVFVAGDFAKAAAQGATGAK